MNGSVLSRFQEECHHCHEAVCAAAGLAEVRVMLLRSFRLSDLAALHGVANRALLVPPWPQVEPAGWSRDRLEQELSPVSRYADHFLAVAEVSDEEGPRVLGVICGHPLVPFLVAERPCLAAVADLGRGGGRDVFFQRDIILDPRLAKRAYSDPMAAALENHACERGYGWLMTRTHPRNRLGIRFFLHRGYQAMVTTLPDMRTYFAKNLASLAREGGAGRVEPIVLPALQGATSSASQGFEVGRG